MARIHRNSDSSSCSTASSLKKLTRGWRPARHSSTGCGGCPPACQHKFKAGTRRKRALLTGDSSSQREPILPLPNNTRPMRFLRGRRTDAAPESGFRSGRWQYCHQADAVIGLPGKFDRLAFSCCQKRWQCSGLRVTPAPPSPPAPAPDAGAVRQVIPLREDFQRTVGHF